MPCARALRDGHGELADTSEMGRRLRPGKATSNLIRAADEFILLDDVQLTKRDWRSRNRIKTKDDLHWLTVAGGTPKDAILQTNRRRRRSSGSRNGRSRHSGQTIRGAYARGAPLRRGTREPLGRTVRGAVLSNRLSLVAPFFRRCHLPRARHHHAHQVVVGSITPATGAISGSIDLCVKAGAANLSVRPGGARATSKITRRLPPPASP